jgi:hypothetical protein
MIACMGQGPVSRVPRVRESAAKAAMFEAKSPRQKRCERGCRRACRVCAAFAVVVGVG